MEEESSFSVVTPVTDNTLHTSLSSNSSKRLTSADLRRIRNVIESHSLKNVLNQSNVHLLLNNQEFSSLLFNLFDTFGSGFLGQSSWIDLLKSRLLKCESDPKHEDNMEIIELLEANAYMVAYTDDIQLQDFQEIIGRNGIAHSLIKVVGDAKRNHILIDDLMIFISNITSPMKSSILTKNKVKHLEAVFKQHAGGKGTINSQQFKQIILSQNDFCAERIFEIFVEDDSGELSFDQLLHSLQEYSAHGNDEKVALLFKVYDINGDGLVQEKDLHKILETCALENNLNIDEHEMNELAKALFEDTVEEGKTYITVDDLKAQMSKYEGLLENLGLIIDNLLFSQTPTKNEKKKGEDKNEWSMPSNSYSIALVLLILANLILFCQRAAYFRHFPMLNGLTPNPFYMLSRACGRTILLNSVLMILCVLRYSITILRNLGLATILPLDHNISFHKIMGLLIFIQAWIHSSMHLINFGVNIQPDPVKFLQLSAPYWKDYAVNWTGMGYTPPDGCAVIETSSGNPNLCPNQSLVIPEGLTLPINLTYCQVCDPLTGGVGYSYLEWIFTSKPGVFGYPGGLACITGILLLAILTIIVGFAMPCVRRSGRFELFYFTHLLFIAYFALLLVHAPDFWMWLVGPLTLYLVELLYRLVTFFGPGRTTVNAAVVFPSNVTGLVINRPAHFKFNPGDWVFIKIPSISQMEWHPFTISSAPEVEDYITLHIRGVGDWTKKLHNYVKDEYEVQRKGLQRHSTNLERITSSVREKFLSAKHSFIAPKIEAESGLLPYYDTNRMRKRKQSRERNNSTETEEKDQQEKNARRTKKVSKVKSLVGSFYRKTDKPIVQFRKQDKQQDTRNDEEVQLKTVSKIQNKSPPFHVYIDGPYGSPSSNIFRAEHAVLIGTGIGVTPFASILQSIMYRYNRSKSLCPNCNFSWSQEDSTQIFNLRKVDFYWINREQKMFEWFTSLLSQLEMEQSEVQGNMDRFLEMHLFITSALQRTDMKAVSLQLAMDLLHKKEKRDLVTGLRQRTNAGRPNWNKEFAKIKDENHGKVTIFYCGNPALVPILKGKCQEFGFQFRKEVF
eukprot:GFUD01015505.1.p1 GENE.GFUD01015505.1~~GFUD01015505.1.p1  ORF type:complete len:1072 (-),score=233.84 GFUD01015505.1:230-3445(-)